MYSVHDRVLVDNMSEFEHSSSRASCTFSMQDSGVKRGSTTGHKTQQARLPADSGLYNSSSPSLVNSILTIPECQCDHHGSCTSTMVLTKVSALSIILAHPWALESFCVNSPPGVSQFTKLPVGCCYCFAPCSCFAHCCHDPFIVRSASNLSTVPGFHSVRASVSMFVITDNCLFLFLFLFQLLGGYLNTTRASVQPSRPLHLHRSKPLRVHTKSVYVRTTSAYLPMRARPEYADFAPDPSSACHHDLVVECEIHGQ